MNDLSWMLYLGGVVGDLKVLFSTAGGLAVAGGCFAAVFGGIESEPPLVRVAKWCIPLGFVGILIAILLPSQNTVYAIAASEMGERALSTPTGTKAMQALDAWLTRQIKTAGEEA